jgi:thiamine-monophosphate kinase
VSDGLLIDATRMAQASGLAVAIDLDAVPLSADYRGFRGQDRAARMAAATAGDDYELLFALPEGERPRVAATRVGRFAEGHGLRVFDREGEVPLPATLGYAHGTSA